MKRELARALQDLVDHMLTKQQIQQDRIEATSIFPADYTKQVLRQRLGLKDKKRQR
jgi:hypothetical protein